MLSFLLVKPNLDDPARLGELAEIVDQLPDLVATFDQDGRLVLLNEAGQRQLGHLSKTELSALILTDLYDDADAERIVNEALPEAVVSGSWVGRARLRTGAPDTEHRILAHRPGRSRAQSFTVIARTEAGSLDNVARNRREMLSALSLGFVHDMNNILGPITAYSDLAAHVLEEASPVRGYLEQIQRATDRARALSSRLAELTRGTVASQALVPLGESTREIVRWVRAARPDLTLELELDEPPPKVWGDAIQLHQVVLNLVQNAAESLSDRPGTVTVSLGRTRAPDGSPDVTLTVRDDGRGVDPDTRQQLFEPFFSTKSEGSGLGLAVSKMIVHEHGGTIHLDDAEPRGTVVTVRIPEATETP